jgi:mono/diheme cytochrome c family protein
VLAVVALGGGAFWGLTAPQTVAAEALGPHVPDLANGKTLFDAGGCAPCHATPEQNDRRLLGGGRALKTPFGTFYAPNVSPDVKDGIGGWSEAQFVTAMHDGVSPGGQHLYPAFPYTSYAHMRFDDVRDLFAYMKTLPAVSGRAPPHQLSFPFTLRRGIGLWKRAFLDRTVHTPTPSESAQWNRGAYLVDAVAHCAECHSPRDAFGAIIERQRFAGGPDVDGQGWVSNITQKRLSHWSVDDLTTLLDTGMTPDGDFVGSTMADVTADTALLSDADRLAIATFIKALAPVDGPPRPQKSARATP